MRTRHSGFALRILLLAAVFGAASSAALAQAVSSATVTGRVVDPQQAVIANAQVVFVSVDTGVIHQTVTNQDGLYTETNLPVGRYQMEVTAPSFEKYSQSGIELRVNDNIQLNVSMVIGSAMQTVQVEANASMVQTQENHVSQVIDERRIVELPLNGRDPTQLITISGAAVNHTDGTNTGSKSFLTAQSIAVAGGGGDQTNYLLDGGDNNDSFTNVNLPFPFPDALQEFSVETNSLPARNGLHPGGLVNVVTKSGSNQWHGSVFEFLRNYLLNARNFFAPTQDSLKRNQFGGTIGGRILTDRLFFFGGYQGSIIRQNPVQTTSYVPTAAALNGDFTALDGGGTIGTNACQANGKPRVLQDPDHPGAPLNTATPMVNPAEYDPAAVALMKYLPTPIDNCGTVKWGPKLDSNEYQYISRVDWNLNQKHQLFGRYFYDNYDLQTPFDIHDLLVTATPGNAQRVQSFTLGDTYSFTSSLVNAFHFTFSRRRIDRGPSADGINAAKLGVQNIYQGTPNYLQLTVSNGGFAVGSGTSALGIFNINSFQEADDGDWLHGKHQVAFGVDLIRTQDNVNSHYEDNAWFEFSNIYSAYTPPTGSSCPTGDTCGSGDPMLDFLTGKMNKLEQTMPQQIAYRQTVPSLYVQDTYHLTPKLVMNAGLRWEPLLPPHDFFNRGAEFSRSAFDTGKTSAVFTNAPAGSFFYGDPGVAKGFTQNSPWNFSPRLGFVFNPDGQGKTTFRVGGAYLYDTLGTYLTYRVTANNLPYGIDNALSSGPYQFDNPYANVPGGNPFPLPFAPPKNISFPLAASQVVLPAQLHPVATAQWNVGFQHQFSANWIATISYLGNRITHMMLGNEIDPAVYIPGTWTGAGTCGALTVSPGTGKACSSTSNTQSRRVLMLANPAEGQYYGQQVLAQDSGFSNYNGMLASLEHRFARSYTVLANYTWSKCLFIGPVNSIGVEGTIQNPYNLRGDYGPCTYDATNIINLTGVVTSNWAHEGWQAHLLNGWQLAPIFRHQSGLPFSPTTGADNSLTGIGLDRPNPTGVSPYTHAGHTYALFQFLNSAAYVPNPVGTFGTAGRGSLRGPGYTDLDVAFSRIFGVYEHMHLEARFEAFNALNHPNFNGPSASISSTTFGKITSAQDPRILQAAMKLSF
jgi:hypothetical protein